jgi:hypothetical protein
MLPERPPTTSARKNVTLWRAHNQRRWRLEKDVLALDEQAPFVCECTSDACARSLMLTMLEYESAHTCPSWTAVLPEHALPDDASTVILRHAHFWVVQLDVHRPGGLMDELAAAVRDTVDHSRPENRF